MNNQTEVIIVGESYVRTYDVEWYDGEIYGTKEVYSNPVIWEGNLDNPPIEAGNYIYIDSIEKKVRVK